MSDAKSTVCFLALSKAQKHIYVQELNAVLEEQPDNEVITGLLSGFKRTERFTDLTEIELSTLLTLFIGLQERDEGFGRSHKAILRQLYNEQERLKKRSSYENDEAAWNLAETENVERRNSIDLVMLNDDARRSAMEMLIDEEEHNNCSSSVNQERLVNIFTFVKGAIELAPDDFVQMNTNGFGEEVVKLPRQHIDHLQYYECQRVVKFVFFNQSTTDRNGKKVMLRVKKNTIMRMGMACCYALEESMSVEKFSEKLAEHGLGRGVINKNGLADKFREKHQDKFAARRNSQSATKQQKIDQIRQAQPIMKLPQSVDFVAGDQNGLFVTVSTEDGLVRKNVFMKDDEAASILGKIKGVEPVEDHPVLQEKIPVGVSFEPSEIAFLKSLLAEYCAEGEGSASAEAIMRKLDGSDL